MSRFTVNKINILSGWVYNLPTNCDCSICRVSLNTNSIYNQDKGVDSFVVQGVCNHSFHYECIKQWIETTNKHCPYCFVQWVYKDKP